MSLSPGLISRRFLFAVLLLAAFAMGGWPGTGRSLYYRDVGQNHLPNRALGAAMIRAGVPPLWDSHRGSGQPFLANPNSLVLRPTTPLFLLFPPERAHVPFLISVMLLAALAGAGAFLLTRECGASDPAAALGALAFVLSGPFLSLGQLVNLLEGAAWIPLALWLFQRALLRGWRPWAPLAGLAAAMVLSAGEPVLAGVLVLGGAALPGWRGPGLRRLPAALLVTLLVAVLVAAAQLLPLLDLVSMSARGGDVGGEEILKWSLPPAALLEMVVPRLWGDPARAAPDHYWGSGLFDTSLPFFPSIHLGMAVAALALLGAAGARRRWWPAAVLGLLGILLALGRHTPAHALLISWVPGLSRARYPVKWLLLTALCTALLAAAGFDRLLKRERGDGGIRRALAPLAALAGLAGGLLWLSGERGEPALRALLAIPPAIPGAVVAAGAVPAVGLALLLAAAGTLLLLFVAGAPSISDGRRPVLALAVAALPLLLATGHLNPKAPPGFILDPSPLLSLVPVEGLESGRFFGHPRPRGFAFRVPSEEQVEETGLPADSLAWGMRWDSRTLRFVAPYLHGVRGAYDQGGESLLGLDPGAAVARRLKEGIPAEERLRLLRAASVRWILAYGAVDHPGLRRLGGLPGESNVPVGLYAVEGSVPRAALVGRARAVASAGEAVEALASGAVDPARTVLLEAPGPVPPGSGPAEGAAEIVHEQADRLSLQVRSKEAAWLVVTDTWAPGWKASVDGAPAEILRANGMFRAVELPAGAHRVEMVYRPGAVVEGLAGSLLGVAAALALILGGLRRRPGGVEA